VNGEIRGIGKYIGGDDAPTLDREIVDNAVKTLY
jgi:hypothetical protein